MSDIKVGNLQVGSALPGYAQVRIDRRTVVGNPYVLGKHGNRDEVIEKYELWLRRQWKAGGPVREWILAHAQRFRQGERQVFMCWCKPAACHGDVLREAVLKTAEWLDLR